MNETPRPLSLGEILDRTVQIYRSRFLVFFGIALIPTAVVLVFAAACFLFIAWAGSGEAASADPALVGILAVAVIAAALLVAMPVLIAVTALGTAAMNHAVARAWLDEKITIRDAWKGAWRRGWNYIGLFLLQTLIVWVAPFGLLLVVQIVVAGAVALAQTAGMGGVAGGALFGLLIILFAVALVGYCIWMLLRLSMAFPACVVERIGATDALKRSFSLSNGTKGRIFLLYLLGTALNYLLSMVIAVPLIIVIALLPGASNPQHAQNAGMVMLFVMYGAGFAVQALTRPVYGIALMLFYYDQRIRLEGYDIEWMMQRAGLVVPPPPQPEAAPWLPAVPRQAPEVELPQAGELLQPATPPQAKSKESL
ncbi:MAG: hypothetical protein ABSC47_04250 [Terracidiphilus sp.]|jgi:hypothetical protein